MLDPDFWNDSDKAAEVIAENNHLKKIVDGFNSLRDSLDDIETSHELLREEYDEELAELLDESVKETSAAIEEYELNLLLSGEHDALDAMLELHSGAGGTESQDWAEMLLRMYQRYSESEGFKIETLDYQSGDEAGVKSVSISIKGPNAYGLLKAEKGVHRLVRISPFDSSGRRHTSFASCEVTPLFKNTDIKIEINTDDIKIDTYRSSGAGGQHVNTTDSAVRITHLPTGVL